MPQLSPSSPNSAGASAVAGEQRHVPVLDGIRGLAILLVMISHLTGFGGPATIDRWGQYFAWWGSTGVDLFFVLSGFLITGILLNTRDKPRYFRNFYARRALRIFPLYYAVLVVAVLVLPRVLPASKAARFGSINDDIIYYFFYLQNFTIAVAGRARHAILDITWSLAIEEQFYLIWPAVVYFLSPRRIKQLCLALFIGAIGARLLATYRFDLTAFGVYVLTPCRVDALAAGAFVAIKNQEQGGLKPYVRNARIALILATTLTLCIAIVEPLLNMVEFYAPGFGQLSLKFGFTLVAIIFTSFLLLVVTADSRAGVVRALSSAPMVWLGKYSYGLYLIHLPIRAVIRDRVYGPAYVSPPHRFVRIHNSEILGQLLFYPLALAPILLVAWLSYHLYEKQFLKLKRYF